MIPVSPRQLVLVCGLLCGLVPRGAAREDVRVAIEKGLRRLDKGAANYVQKRQCFSCHHQATTVSALTSAGKRGFKIDPARLPEQLAFTLKAYTSKKAEILKGRGIPGGNTEAAYALFTLEQAGHKPDETTALLVGYLLKRQRPDGSWPALAKRPPLEGSSFTNNALTLAALKTYGLQTDKTNTESWKKVEQAAAKGKAWLLAHSPKDTEDKMYRLRGLVAAGADPKEIEAARAQLTKEQNADGSWSQLPGLKGDAYATAGVLLALRAAGVAPQEGVYQKAVKFLLRTQKEDGSWLVPIPFTLS
jgi:squalene cyclase